MKKKTISIISLIFVGSCGSGELSDNVKFGDLNNLKYTALTAEQKTVVMTVNNSVADSFHALKGVPTPQTLIDNSLGLLAETSSHSQMETLLSTCNMSFNDCGAEPESGSCYDIKTIAGSYEIDFQISGDDCPISLISKSNYTMTGVSPSSTWSASGTDWTYTVNSEDYAALTDISSIKINEVTGSAEVTKNQSGKGEVEFTATMTSKTYGKIYVQGNSSLTSSKTGEIITATGSAVLIAKLADFNVKAEVNAAEVITTTVTTDPYIYKINNEVVTRREFQALLGSVYSAIIDHQYPFEVGYYEHEGETYYPCNQNEALALSLDPW